MRSFILVFSALLLTRPLYAGDIIGTTATLPPNTLGDFSFLWSNDFFGRGGETDDYRTQQFGLQLAMSPRWRLVFDHSVLTVLENNPVSPGDIGRLDQLSMSIAYVLYRQETKTNNINLVETGAGVRAFGNYGGARMQNSLHKLINNGLTNAPYVDTEISMATIWAKADHQKFFHSVMDMDGNDIWKAGYWLNTTVLVSTDHQYDAVVAANLIARNDDISIWLGVREDWRENYDQDFVMKSTALSESGTSLVLGIGNGPLLFETVQGLNEKSSYGRIAFNSYENQYSSVVYPQNANNSISLNMLLPNVEAGFEYKRLLNYQPAKSNYPVTSFLISYRFGEPTYEGKSDVYNDIRHIAIGLDAEWRDSRHYHWAWPYAAFLVGRRSEQLHIEQITFDEPTSIKVTSNLLEGGAGVRINMFPSKNWRALFQMGVVLRYPFDSQTVEINQSEFQLLEPDLSLQLGFSLNFSL